MNQHTQVEWIAVGHWVTVADFDIADICSCHTKDFGQGNYARSYDEALANAQLIAAAPELLAVCLRL